VTYNFVLGIRHPLAAVRRMLREGRRLEQVGDLQGHAKIVMQHYQIKKGESATDEDMCILHDRKSGSGDILQALPASPAGNTHAERSFFAHDPRLAPDSVRPYWAKLLPFFISLVSRLNRYAYARPNRSADS